MLAVAGSAALALAVASARRESRAAAASPAGPMKEGDVIVALNGDRVDPADAIARAAAAQAM